MSLWKFWVKYSFIVKLYSILRLKSIYIFFKLKPGCVPPSDVPGPVGIPLTAENLSSDSCKLNWFFPENDGGSPISNFIIEKREAERKAWTSVSFTASRQNAVAHGLTIGKSYFFRVAAENAIGIGPFVETAAEVIIKEPISEFNKTSG